MRCKQPEGGQEGQTSGGAGERVKQEDWSQESDVAGVERTVDEEAKVPAGTRRDADEGGKEDGPSGPARGTDPAGEGEVKPSSGGSWAVRPCRGAGHQGARGRVTPQGVAGAAAAWSPSGPAHTEPCRPTHKSLLKKGHLFLHHNAKAQARPQALGPRHALPSGRVQFPCRLYYRWGIEGQGESMQKTGWSVQREARLGGGEGSEEGTCGDGKAP